MSWNQTDDTTPWRRRWEREFRYTRWFEKDGKFFPMPAAAVRRLNATVSEPPQRPSPPSKRPTERP